MDDTVADSGGLQKTTLRKSQFGTGVFAAERILAGELVCGAFPLHCLTLHALTRSLRIRRRTRIRRDHSVARVRSVPFQRLKCGLLGRRLLAIHRRSNYLFGLNPQFGIDAVHAGNEARFVNHREHDNVAAYSAFFSFSPRQKKATGADDGASSQARQWRTPHWAFCQYVFPLISRELSIIELVIRFPDRTIKPGTELFIDYGKDFFKDMEAKEDSELESYIDVYEDTQEWIPSQ